MKTSLFAAIAAAAALTSAQAAQAKQACYAPDDLSDAAIYMMPIAFDAAKSVCSKQLEPKGFMMSKGEKFIAPFRAKQSKSWPGAFRVMKTYIAQSPQMSNAGGFNISGMLSQMDANSVRPFADGMLGQMISGQIKPSHCNRIERGMELLGPLPSENVAGLFPFVADIANLTNIKLCTGNKR